MNHTIGAKTRPGFRNLGVPAKRSLVTEEDELIKKIISARPQVSDGKTSRITDLGAKRFITYSSKRVICTRELAQKYILSSQVPPND
jgi:hypothetical protein